MSEHGQSRATRLLFYVQVAANIVTLLLVLVLLASFNRSLARDAAERQQTLLHQLEDQRGTLRDLTTLTRAQAKRIRQLERFIRSHALEPPRAQGSSQEQGSGTGQPSPTPTPPKPKPTPTPPPTPPTPKPSPSPCLVPLLPICP